MCKDLEAAENCMSEKLSRLWPGEREDGEGEVSRGQISGNRKEGLGVSMLWAG